MDNKYLMYQKGQVVLITLLVLATATTVALSLTTRASTDVKLTSQIEESSKALSAAEAGIEQALESGTGSTGTISSINSDYDVSVNTLGGSSGIYSVPNATLVGETETIWLVEHNTDGTLKESTSYDPSKSLILCFSKSNPEPAVVVSVIYKSLGSYYMAKGAFDPDTDRQLLNNFSNPDLVDGVCGDVSMHRQTIDFSLGFNIPAGSTLLAVRLQPIYTSSQFRIDSGLNTLPPQGNVVVSSGTTTSGVSRKIIVYQQYKGAPSIFDAVVLSKNAFMKQ